MKVMVTGAKGQLGIELVRQAQAHDIVCFDHYGLDITNATAVATCIAKVQPDVVINAAAYTAVDRAESEVETAFAVNRDGPANLATGCALLGIPLIHVSTDYVFDGIKEGAYVEGDPVAPKCVYGESKLVGEVAVQSICPNSVILRTSWVFSAHGNNFVKTMLKLMRERETLRVVDDQRGCPTSAGELARAIYHIIDQYSEDKVGIYHFCQPEAVTWHGFAEAIAEVARGYMPLKVKHIEAITTAAFPTPARRPANSVLNGEKISTVFGIKAAPWWKSLESVIGEC